MGILLLAGGCENPTIETPVYEIESIRDENLASGAVFKPFAINNSDTIVGVSAGFGGVFIVEGGELVARPDLLEFPWDISANGIIVGGGFPHAYLNDAGNLSYLPDLVDLSQYSGSTFYGVNSQGTAVGILDFGEEGIIYESGQLIKINICGENTNVYPADINDNGTVIGYCQSSFNHPPQAGFVRYNGEFFLLSAGQLTLNMPMGINENDIVLAVTLMKLSNTTALNITWLPKN